MKIKDFKIGEKFFGPAGFEWLCTDKGTRTIVAIMLTPDKGAEWFVGPPYSLEEVVFDDYQMERCYSDTMEMINDRIDNLTVHPGFLAEDFLKMIKEKRSSRLTRKYPREKLLKRDRIGVDGEIWHPYDAYKKNDIWFVKIFEVFSREFSEMKEDDFARLKFSDESAMRARKMQVESKN